MVEEKKRVINKHYRALYSKHKRSEGRKRSTCPYVKKKKKKRRRRKASKQILTSQFTSNTIEKTRNKISELLIALDKPPEGVLETLKLLT